MKVELYDELGNRWMIRGGMPANKFISKLTRANYRLIVLPLRTLATGVLAEPVEQPADIIRCTRLADCLLLLRGD